MKKNGLGSENKGNMKMFLRYLTEETRSVDTISQARHISRYSFISFSSLCTYVPHPSNLRKVSKILGLV